MTEHLSSTSLSPGSESGSKQPYKPISVTNAILGSAPNTELSSLDTSFNGPLVTTSRELSDFPATCESELGDRLRSFQELSVSAQIETLQTIRTLLLRGKAEIVVRLNDDAGRSFNFNPETGAPLRTTQDKILVIIKELTTCMKDRGASGPWASELRCAELATRLTEAHSRLSGLRIGASPAEREVAVERLKSMLSPQAQHLLKTRWDDVVLLSSDSDENQLLTIYLKNGPLIDERCITYGLCCSLLVNSESIPCVLFSGSDQAAIRTFKHEKAHALREFATGWNPHYSTLEESLIDEINARISDGRELDFDSLMVDISFYISEWIMFAFEMEARTSVIEQQRNWYSKQLAIVSADEESVIASITQTSARIVELCRTPSQRSTVNTFTFVSKTFAELNELLDEYEEFLSKPQA